MLQELLQGKRPAFILTSEGKAQYWKSEHGVGIVIATSPEAAKVLATQFEQQQGRKVAVSEVGMAQEPLHRQIAFSVAKGGADGIFVTEDGTTNKYFKAPPVSTGE